MDTFEAYAEGIRSRGGDVKAAAEVMQRHVRDLIVREELAKRYIVRIRLFGITIAIWR